MKKKDWLENYPFTISEKEQLRFDVDKIVKKAVKGEKQRIKNLLNNGDVSKKVMDEIFDLMTI